MMRLLCLFTALVLAAGTQASTKIAPIPRDSIYQLALQLTDQSGHKIAWSSRRGKPQILSMFYTSCPYICPLLIESGKAVEKSLPPGNRARLGILFISMDPKRDTPAALNLLATKRKLNLTRWTLASPALADVRLVAGVLGIRYRALADGEFNHTRALVLVDAEGRILSRTEQLGSKLDPEFLVAVRRATASNVERD